MTSIPTNLIYESLMLVCGLLCLLANGILLLCIWKATPKKFRPVGVLLANFIVLEMISGLIIMLLQPRFIPTDQIYFFIPQGPIQLSNLRIWSMYIYDFYMSLLYTRTFFIALLIVINFINLNTSICTSTSLIIIGILLNSAIFVAIFAEFFQCRSPTTFMKWAAEYYGIDYYNSPDTYRIIWYGTIKNCPLVFITGYIVIGVCILCIPIIIYYYKKISKKARLFSKNEMFSRQQHVKGVRDVFITRSMLHIPSLCLYLFYKNNDINVEVWSDIVVYLFPLLSSVLSPILIINGQKYYKEYVLKLLKKKDNQTLVMELNNRNIAGSRRISASPNSNIIPVI